jgi:uncharacterized RDD family membrane protein YckC
MQFHPKDLSELDELTEEHLGFSALSDGLGFAKQAKAKVEPKNSAERNTTPTFGAGAVSAGPARPAPAMFQSPKYSNSLAAASSPVIPVSSAATLAAPSASPTAKAAATMAATAAASSPAATLTMPAASPVLRMAAFFLDFGVVFFPLLSTWMFSFGSEALPIFFQNPRTPLTLLAIIFVVYFLLSESFGGQSLGKMALGLRIVEDDKYEKPIRLNQTVFRLVTFFFGILLAGAGLWLCFRDAKLRPWHDRYTGTIVRKKP